jgi:hypothetical protein
MARRGESTNEKILRLFKEGRSIPSIANELTLPTDVVTGIIEKRIPDFRTRGAADLTADNDSKQTAPMSTAAAAARFFGAKAKPATESGTNQSKEIAKRKFIKPVYEAEEPVEPEVKPEDDSVDEVSVETAVELNEEVVDIPEESTDESTDITQEVSKSEDIDEELMDNITFDEDDSSDTESEVTHEEESDDSPVQNDVHTDRQSVAHDKIKHFILEQLAESEKALEDVSVKLEEHTIQFEKLDTALNECKKKYEELLAQVDEQKSVLDKLNAQKSSIEQDIRDYNSALQ